MGVELIVKEFFLMRLEAALPVVLLIRFFHKREIFMFNLQISFKESYILEREDIDNVQRLPLSTSTTIAI